MERDVPMPDFNVKGWARDNKIKHSRWMQVIGGAVIGLILVLFASILILIISVIWKMIL